MLDKIINSQVRLAILGFLFRNPDKKYYAREIVKELNLDQANTHKELQNLIAGQFLVTETINNKKYFFVNQKNIFFDGLKELLSHYQTENRQSDLVCIEEMPNYYPMMVTFAWNTGFANDYFSRLGLKRD